MTKPKIRTAPPTGREMIRFLKGIMTENAAEIDRLAKENWELKGVIDRMERGKKTGIKPINYNSDTVFKGSTVKLRRGD